MAKKRFNPIGTLTLALLHLGFLIGLVKLPSASPWVWLLALVLGGLSMLGVNAGYHRLETHGSFRCKPAARWFLLACAAISLQGKTIGWVLTHWSHHEYVDEPGKDPHSPFEYPGWKGVGWAHMGWLCYHYERPPKFQRSKQLEQDAAIMWFERYYPLFILVTFGIPLALGGWDGFWIAGMLRIVVSYHLSWSINSVGHKWGKPAMDSQGNEYLADDSRNNKWLVHLTFGEAWHAYHHVSPGQAYYDVPWHQDLAGSFIRVLGTIGWATNIRRPKKYKVYTVAQRTPPQRQRAMV